MCDCPSILENSFVPMKIHILYFCTVLEAVVQRCSLKKVFLKISQYWQENTWAFIEEEKKVQVFFCQYCEILRTIFFVEHLPSLDLIYIFFFHYQKRENENAHLHFFINDKQWPNNNVIHPSRLKSKKILLWRKKEM